MDYNPYAAPQAQQAPAHAAPLADGQRQPWDVVGVFGEAWEAFKPHWAILVFSWALAWILGLLPGVVVALARSATGISEEGTASYWVIHVVLLVLTFVVEAFLRAGLLKIRLAAARGETPDFVDLFRGGSKLFPLVLALLPTSLPETVASELMSRGSLQILRGRGIAVVSSAMPLVAAGSVIGILTSIVGIGLLLAPYYVIDADMGGGEALRASWNATSGSRWKLFAFFLLMALVVFSGLVACCVGWLVTTPICFVAEAIVFVRMTGRGTRAQAQSPSNPPAPPPGYGGSPPGYGHAGGATPYGG
jgi:hypothetical protein